MADTVRETSRNTNQAGVYRHPETGAEVVVENHPKFGTTKADGFVRAGYVFDRPADAEPKKTEEKEDKRVEMPTEENPQGKADKKGGK